MLLLLFLFLLKSVSYNAYIFRCKSLESRIAAFEVLTELATGCPENMEKIAKQLISMHHSMKPELAKEYEVITHC